MSVIYRPDRKKWQASVSIRGQRKRPLFITKKEAEDFERKCRLGKIGLKEQQDSILISKAFPSYFETESELKSEKSKDNDQRYLNFAFHFLTVVRQLEYLNEVELEDLQAFQQWIAKPHEFGKPGDDDHLIKEAWSLPTVSRCCHVLKHLFTKMMMTRRIKEDPTTYWMIPAGESKRRRPMTQWEFEQLLAVCPDWFRPILSFMRLTGARGGAIAGLTWGDVDLSKRVLFLKSSKGKRKDTGVKLIPVPIFDELFSLLVSERNKTPFAGPYDPVFRNRVGTAINGRHISVFGSRLVKKTGIEGIVLYGMRHAIATDLTDAGVSLETARQMLGHSNIQTTQIYARGSGIQTVSKAMELIRGKSETEKEVAPIATKKKEDPA